MKTAAAFAIINFLWQGAAIGLVAWLGFALSRSPRVRYLIGVGALLAMTAALVMTFVVSMVQSPVQGPESVQGSGSVQSSGSVRSATTADPALWTGSGLRTDSGLWTDLGLWTGENATLVFSLWIVGVALLSARLAFGWLGVRRLTQRVTDAGASVHAIASQLIAAMNIRAPVRIVESALVKVPAVIGAFKPVVLLPAAAMTGLSMEQVEALLAHELAHVRRHDYLVNLLQSAVETLLFYHPAVWLVSRRVRLDRELCCDDLALAVCADRVAYASALADLESLRATPSPALAATGGSLLARVRRILGHDEVSALAGRSQSLAGIAILASIILLAGGQVARARAIPLTGPGVEIVEPDGTGGRRAPGAPEIQGPVVGVPRGVVGGVQGGVSGGVSGGVPSGVAGGVQGSVPILISASDNPTLKIMADTDITVRVKSNGKAVKQFTDRPLTVSNDGSVMLPLLGRHAVAGKTLREAATSIRSDLIYRKFFADPEVDVRANMSIIPAVMRPEPPPVEAAKEAVPEPQAPSGPSIAVGQIVRLEVSVGLVRQAEFNKDYTVQPDGTIVVPYLDAVKAAGLTTAALQAAIASALNSTNTLPGAKVAASIETRQAVPAPQPAPIRGVAVTVQGAVRTPGSVLLAEDHTAVSDAISAAGGFQSSAGSRIFVKRRRQNAPDLTLSKAEILQGRNANVKLEDGDTVTVEVAPSTAQHFSLAGSVKNPGQYDWEAGMTLHRALALAGEVLPVGLDRAVLQGFAAQTRQEWGRKNMDAQDKKAVWDTLAKVDLNGDPVVASRAAPQFSSDRFVLDLNQRIFDKEATRKQMLEVDLLGPNNPRVVGVDTDINTLRAQLKGRLSQIVESARQEYEGAKATEARYKALYLSQEAQANLPPGLATANRVTIERKDPKTGKLTNIKLNKDPMTTPVEPGDVIKVPAKRL